MSKTYDFLKACGVFYVLTVNGDYPAGRPFGAVMEYENELYLSTADGKAVYDQLKQHKEMQIIALKPHSREWIRVSGIAVECNDLKIKQEMLKVCPALTKHFPSADSEHYVLFKITEREAFWNTDSGSEKWD